MAIHWDTTLSLGVSALDEQHREFFAHLRTFLDACKNAQGAEALGDVLAYLRAYALTHFRDEERYMAEIGFPYAGTHIEQHRDFVAKVDALAASFAERGPRVDTVAEAMELASSWLIHHIKSSDLLIVRWLRREP